MLHVGGEVFALRHVSASELALVEVKQNLLQKLVVGVATIAFGLPALIAGLIAAICVVALLLGWVFSGFPEAETTVKVLLFFTVIAVVLFLLLGLVVEVSGGFERWRLQILLSNGRTAVDLFDRNKAPLEKLQRQINHARSDETYRGPVIKIRDVFIGNRIDSGGGPVQMGGSGNQA